MLRDRPAAALDVASQRIESLEQIAKGVQTDIARRLELVGPEKASLVTTNKASGAGKEVLQEERIHYWNSRGARSGRATENGPEEEKGKTRTQEEGRKERPTARAKETGTKEKERTRTSRGC